VKDQRELYQEMNELLGAIAKALDIEPEAAARALEQGGIGVDMREDERGQRYLSVTYGARTVKVYQGAIRHAPGL